MEKFHVKTEHSRKEEIQSGTFVSRNILGLTNLKQVISHTKHHSSIRYGYKIELRLYILIIISDQDIQSRFNSLVWTREEDVFDEFEVVELHG